MRVSSDDNPRFRGFFCRISFARWYRLKKRPLQVHEYCRGLARAFLMHMKIHTVVIKTLLCHERVNRRHLSRVINTIRKDRRVYRPVIVDRDSYVILDGHHRVAALQRLGAIRAPVVFVRYKDARVRVYLRRKKLLMSLIKQYVVDMAISGRLCPSKTTRHLIRNRPDMKPISITKLM